MKVTLLFSNEVCFYNGECFEVISESVSDVYTVTIAVCSGHRWVTRRALQTEGGTGLKWGQGETLTNLDFADDVVLVSESAEQLQLLTDSVATSARVIGLHINVEKTKIHGLLVERTDDFWYLGSAPTNTGIGH